MPTATELAQQAEQLSELEWFDFLDEIDAVHRRRNQDRRDDAPVGRPRDEVAAWLARTHFVVDVNIREVWYVPTGAPPDEIRFLEVNDRYLGPEHGMTPVVFHINDPEIPFRLLVVDVSSDELDQCLRDPSRLPAGWSLDGHVIWRRRA